jgi:hypothetical protein
VCYDLSFGVGGQVVRGAEAIGDVVRVVVAIDAQLDGLRDVVVGKYGKELKAIVERAKGNDNPALREVAADVDRLYGLSSIQP